MRNEMSVTAISLKGLLHDDSVFSLCPTVSNGIFLARHGTWTNARMGLFRYY